MDAVTHLALTVGVLAACDVLGVARASFYRQRPVFGPPASPAPEIALPPDRAAPARSLSTAERADVLTVLHAERFQDRSPAAVHATLLDEGQYLCSIRTMYRILEKDGESRERRDQLVHPAYQRPELLATAPNQLWSWDITKLLGPAKWTYFYLYVILDVLSRYVAGWMVAPREKAELAQAVHRRDHRQTPGSPRPAQHPRRPRQGHDLQTGRLLMADLGVTKTHSRPYVSDDNPYSESQFRTLKYRPSSPTVWAASRTAARSANSFSTGITKGIAIPASGCSPLRWSTSAKLRRLGAPTSGARRRIPGTRRPLRSATAQTAATALGGLDQQAGPTGPQRSSAAS